MIRNANFQPLNWYFIKLYQIIKVNRRRNDKDSFRKIKHLCCHPNLQRISFSNTDERSVIIKPRAEFCPFGHAFWLCWLVWPYCILNSSGIVNVSVDSTENKMCVPVRMISYRPEINWNIFYQKKKKGIMQIYLNVTKVIWKKKLLIVKKDCQ